MNLKLIMSRCAGIWLTTGGLMAEQLPKQWITIQDEETGLRADFPHRPLEMTFEIPFQNTPPLGKIRFYSIPLPEGTLVLSIFNSSTVTSDWLKKKQLYHFFETILVPRFFFNPAVFQNQQTFAHQLQSKGDKAASFQISYEDQGIVKKLEGIAKVKKQTLYTYFYLASEEDFNQQTFEHFLKSIHVIEPNE